MYMYESLNSAKSKMLFLIFIAKNKLFGRYTFYIV